MPKPPVVSSWRSVDGLDMVQTTWPCGCFHEEAHRGEELELIRFQACSKCFDDAIAYLDYLCVDIASQLTLSLPSEGDRGQSA